MPEFPIAGGFYVDASKPISSQECINWIPQVPQTNALSAAQLITTPGITQFATAGITPARGSHVMNGIAYIITNTTLYSINSDGTTTSKGTIIGITKVSIADNGVQMCIVVPGSTAYIFTVAGGLTTITDSDFTTTLGPSQQVVFVDGYFVHFNNASAASTSPIFFVSNLKDGTAYDALDFGTAEADPDDITGIHVSRNQLYIGGGQTIEPFANVGGAGFPFQRISGGVVPKGVKAKFSMIEFDDSYAFVGGGLNEQPSVWKFTGSSGQKISTAAIDNIILSLSDTDQDDIFCTVYGEYGGFFLNVHIKDRVLTFDSAASALSGGPVWHERKSKNKFGQAVVWRVNGIIKAYGKTLVTDNQDGRIGEMDRDTYTEYGTSINRVFSTIPFHAEGERVTVAEMELTCESGTATATGAGSDPHITRSYSDNGGLQFGNETSRSLGKQGEYNKRQIWRREGQLNRFRVFRFIHDEPIKASVIKLDADLVLDND
jgi:hypothetical protein